MTKGRVTLPWRVVAGRKAFFITLGGPKAHDSSGRDDKFVAWAKLSRRIVAFKINLSSRPERSDASYFVAQSLRVVAARAAICHLPFF
jgi:hypothetical protein